MLNPRGMRVVVRIAAGQLGVALLVALAFLAFSGFWEMYSALIGGGIGAIASLLMGCWVFRGDADAKARDMMRAFYFGEFFKLAVTVVMFVFAIVWVRVSPLPLMSAYAASVLAYWLALASPRFTGNGNER